jgi:DNA-binding NtrC family response regulator
MNAVDFAQPTMLNAHAVVQTIGEELEFAQATQTRVMITGGQDFDRATVARLVHGGSVRRNTAFICLDAATTPESILASQLFEALSMPVGTVFLDNVGHLTPQLQDLLYAFLDSASRRLTVEGLRFNVRVISGTRRNLWPEVTGGSFREDLYYRLNVMLIAMPE